MGERDGIVAVGLLTGRDLAMLGEGFRRAYRLDEGHDFHELLAAIDEAERAFQSQQQGAPQQMESRCPEAGLSAGVRP